MGKKLVILAAQSALYAILADSSVRLWPDDMRLIQSLIERLKSYE